MNSMDIDRPPKKRLASSPPASSSSSKRAKFLLPSAQLSKLNGNMKRKFRVWRLIEAEADAGYWPVILEFILMDLTLELASTTMRDIVIAPLTRDGAADILNKFTKDELEQFKVGVLNARNSDDWGDLITHRLYRPKPLHQTAFYIKALETAWKSTYVGTEHEVLLQNINAMSRSKPYSNSVVVIQSLGTGKSRLVDEQGKLVFTIPFNLHSQADSEAAYPYPDFAISDHLVLHCPRDLDNAQVHYLNFLHRLFRQVQRELKSHMTKLPTYQDLASTWHEHLATQNNRESLYQSVVDFEASKNEEDSEDEGSDMCAAVSRARDAAEQLLKTIDDLVESTDNNGNIKLMLYFDKAHSLIEATLNNGMTRTLYDVFCSRLNTFLDYPIFTIFVSTASYLQRFPPTKPMARSARIREAPESIQAPITETPFDCAPDFLVKPLTLRLADICAIDFMSNFGRPLFWTLIKAAEKLAIQGEILPIIVDLARAKLTCAVNIYGDYADFSTAAKLAVIDVRLMLDYEPRRHAIRDLEEELVASHMRIAYSIPKHREYIQSGYPSEPIIAEAAAQQMLAFRTSTGTNTTLDTLAQHVKEELLDHRGLDELAGRLLLMAAYDRAIERENLQKDPNKPPLFSQGCFVTTFIEELFGDEHAKEILDSQPDNLVGGKRLGTALSGAIIRFTHFGKMGDDEGASSDMAYAAFIRCMAIICCSGKATTGCIIPILLRDEHLCEAVMSGILIQFKRRIKKGTRAKCAIDEADVQFFPSNQNGEAASRFYMTWMLELGAPPLPTLAVTRTKVRKAKMKEEVSRTARNRNWRSPSIKVDLAVDQAHPPTTHPRYSLFVYGCSSDVYNVISPSENETYALFLCTREFLGEHPRQNSESLALVQKLKPFWSPGHDCYHWLENGVENPAETMAEEEIGYLTDEEENNEPDW